MTGAPTRAAAAVANWRHSLRHLPPVLGVVLMLASIWVVHREFRHLRLEDIAAALEAISRPRLLAGFAVTIAAYLVLTLYDLLGSVYAGHRLPYRRIAFASFCAYALSHNLGVSALSGGAVRFRLYAGWGLSPLQIGKLVGFCSLTFAFGGLVLGGGALIFTPAAMPFFGTHLPHLLLRLIGGAMWASVLVYLGLSTRGTHKAVLFGHCFPLPALPMAVLQVLLATTDVSTAAGIFYVLLPGATHLTFLKFLAVYVMSYTAGVAASLPGGIGVFDTVMLLGLSTYLPAARVVGAIVIFRLYYYVIPLFLAGTLFSAHEILLRGQALFRASPAGPGGAAHWSESDFAIAAGTGATALCGTMLLAMGVIAPSVDAGWIDPGFSATLVAGHFIPSLIGAALLVLCSGLAQRVRLAWVATIGLLLAAAFYTAISAHLVWIPAVLVLASFVLAPYRHAFHRDTRFGQAILQPAGLVPLFALMLCVLSLAVFERHVRFVTSNSWWRIVTSADVPPSVRIAVGFSVLVGMAALWRVLRPGPARPEAVAWTIDGRIRYAALGGKPPVRADGIVWSEAEHAAMPFRRLGPVLVGLGDPAGAPRERVAVLWRLRALAAAEGRTLAVYRAGPDLLDVYGGLGLAAVPLGEDGLPLAEQPDRQPLRPAAYLMCADKRDLAILLPALPELAGTARRLAA